MGKLLICLAFVLGVSGVMLQLRQQYLSLNYQTDRLHSQIEARQAGLWGQQLRIAEETAPNAIAAKVRQQHILLAPESMPMAKNWLDPEAAGEAMPAADKE
jgi:cell division protein FtsL